MFYTELMCAIDCACVRPILKKRSILILTDLNNINLNFLGMIHIMQFVMKLPITYSLSFGTKLVFFLNKKFIFSFIYCKDSIQCVYGTTQGFFKMKDENKCPNLVLEINYTYLQNIFHLLKSFLNYNIATYLSQ